MAFIEIERKEDSLEKLEAIEGKPTKLFLKATEFNTVVDKINELSEATADDKILFFSGTTFIGSTLTVLSQLKWRISNIVSILPEDKVFNISLSSSGMARIVNVIGNINGSVTIMEGAESENPVAPEIPANSILITFLIVNDSVLETAPVIVDNYVTKSEKGLREIYGIGSEIVDNFTLKISTNYVIKTGVSVINGFNFFTGFNKYPGQKVSFRNDSNVAVQFTHNVGIVKAMMLKNENYILQPTETIEFDYDLVNNKLFQTGQITSSASIKSTTYSGINYTFVLADVGNRKIFTSSNPVTLTIPTNDDLALTDAFFEYTQIGDGVVTIGGTGVTIKTNLSRSSVKNETRRIRKTGTNTWTIDFGSLALDKVVPYTVYIDTVNGNDVTAKIETANLPFKTDTAAYAAMPSDNGITWTIIYSDTGNITRVMTSAIPNRPLRIVCNSFSGSFDYSLINLSTRTASIDIYTPFCDFRHSGTADFRIGTSGLLKMEVQDIYRGTQQNVQPFIFSYTSGSYVKCRDFIHTVPVLLYGFYISELTITGKLTTLGAVHFLAGGNTKFKINEIANSGGTLMCGPLASLSFSISKITGSGTLTLMSPYSFDCSIDLTGLKITGVGFYIINNVHSTGTITVTGVTDQTAKINFNRRVGNTGGTGKIILDRLKAYVNNLDVADQWFLDFNSCDLKVDAELIKKDNEVDPLLGVTFRGYNVIAQTTPGELIKNVNTATNVQKYGTIRSNATSLGANVTTIDNTPNLY